MKLAVVMSHPIQYQVSLLRKMAKKLPIKVLFCWNYGIEETYDKEFDRKVRWDIPLLEGYPSTFLRNYSPMPSSEFWGQINFGVINELKNVDAILVFGWNSFTNWLVFLLAPWYGVRIILQSESPLKHELLKSKWKLLIKKIILRFVFSRVSAFLYIGKENKNFYLSHGIAESKLFFAPYAVENERYLEESGKLKPKEELRKELGIPKNAVVFLFVGKLIGKKRPLDLLRAYEKAIKEAKLLGKEICLVFVGDGTQRAELERYMHLTHVRNVMFAGFRNQTELSKFYASSDVLVLPSGMGETWGLVVNEAMLFGLPVIASDLVGCVSDLISGNGLVFPSGNVESLSNCIVEMVRDEGKRRSFGKQSTLIIADYAQDKCVDALCAVSIP